MRGVLCRLELATPERPIGASSLFDKIGALNVVLRSSACLGATAADGAASSVKEYRQVTMILLTRFVRTRLGIDGVLASARRD